MAAPPTMQTAIVQTASPSSTSTFPLDISHTVPVPRTLPSAHHVLVRVLAVALNPTDYKMVTHFPMAGNMVGCDFCGIVEHLPAVAAAEATTKKFPPGTRVCGGTFPYSKTDTQGGAFAQWITVDSRLLLRVPAGMDDLQAAALGGVGWGTAGLAFYDPTALALKGRPSQPLQTPEPVLVYGGGTASGTMACQLLKLSGYTPIAVASPASAALALKYGAASTASYTSPTCAETVRSLSSGKPIRRALDCITSAESAATCFAALARTGGRYACLESLDASFPRRRAVVTKEVMGYEGLGVRIDLGEDSSTSSEDEDSGMPSTYSREANTALFDATAKFAAEDVQVQLDAGSIRPHPVQLLPAGWQGILDGLAMLQKGQVRGHKLVARISM